MYEFKFTDEQTEKIKNKTNALDELLKKFNEVDEKYSIKKIEDGDTVKLELERQTFERPSEESVIKQAKDSLADYENSSKMAIENEYSAKQKKLDEQLAQYEIDKEKTISNLESAYSSAKQKAENDAIKRGLARSSIIVNKLKEYDESMLEQFAQIEKNYLETTQKLNAEKNLLEIQRQNALDAFDISYAVKLSEKIAQIQEKIDKTERETIEFNNKMEQLEKEFEAKMKKELEEKKQQTQKNNLSLLEYYAKYGMAQVEKLKEDEKFDIAYSYLMSLPKEDAIIEVQNNPIFKDNLKSSYSKLLTAIQNRG